jgi:sec-independent protein translocase protein TatB
MLPDLSPTHILIVIVVALIVVGPKDLPNMLRRVGQFMGKMRGMANEFRASFDEMARQSELDELRKEVAAMRQATTDALPQDLGIQSSLDADNAYMTNWAASHATPTDAPPEAFAYDPPAIQAPTAGEIAAEAKAAKPRAPRKPKAAAEAGDASEPAKPSTRKSRAKPAAGDEA